MFINIIDLILVLGSIVGFLVFLVAHIVAFRMIDSRDAVRSFFILVLAIGTILGIFQYTLHQLSFVEALLSVFLFLMLSCCYFMGIFGLMATSVRIRILCEIAKEGKKGMTMRELVARYNHEVIVGQRLARLVSNGDLTRDKGTYTARGGYTFFSFPALILTCMNLLYGPFTQRP